MMFSTYHRRKEYQNDLAQWFMKVPWQYFVTLAFNHNVDKVAAASALNAFDARLDRKLIGRDWASVPGEDRTQFLYWFERGHSKLQAKRDRTDRPHYHLRLEVRRTWRPMSDEDIRLAIEKIWKDLEPQGTVDVQRKLPGYDKNASYVTKEMVANPELYDEWGLMPPPPKRPRTQQVCGGF